jgi:hypothetical protein
MLNDISREIIPPNVYLLAIVEVGKPDRIQCQAEGCGHSVYKRIHIVLNGLQFKVLGARCYERLYGHAARLVLPQYGSGTGRHLTADERQTLVQNTAAFIERLEAERIELERKLALEAATQREMELAQAARRSALKIHQSIRRPDLRHQIDRDERSPLYEGNEMLCWKWRSEEEIAASMAEADANPPHGPYQASVMACFKVRRRPTPYAFALDVEVRHCLPKAYIFRALDELDLIERTHR